jgi:transaldolase
MKITATKQLQDLGQSLWLDYIRRDLMSSGELKRLIEEDGVHGMTSNPTIFEKAIAGSDLYDDRIQEILATQPEILTADLFEKLEIQDIRNAAEVLRPLYENTNGNDGFVSIEVNPHLAFDALASIAEARRLWEEVGEPNIMVKIPATPQGMEAIEELIAEGINVNVTLIFSVAQYECVAEAYLKGLKRNPKPDGVSSVASFFVSRVDTVVDQALDDLGTAEALKLKGRIAVVNARLAYRCFRQIFFGDAFKELRQKGACAQRPLWASTSTKNKAYSDVLYVEELIGPDTVNSVPPATLEAFRDHGKAHVTLLSGENEAEDAIGVLARHEINLQAIGQSLLTDGVELFSDSYDKLLAVLEKKRKALLAA